MTTRSSQRFGRRATAALVLGFLQIISLSAQDDAQKKELIARYGTPGEHSPEVTHVSLVAPNVIELTIEAQKVVPTTLVAYVAQPGDRKKIQKWPDGTVRRAIVVRDGTEIGWLQGKKLDQFSAFEGIEGDPLLHFLGENPANFKIASKDDPAFQPPQQPEAVFRKSVPIDWQMPMNVFPMRHRIYLQLKGKLTPGKSYQIAVSNLNVRNPELSFVNNPNKVRSDAVHVNQLGYRPDDPGKRAFLSTWLGTGGALIYPEGLRFSVVNDATGKSMLSGTVKLVLAPEQTETLAGKDTPNHSKTAIYSMDFDALSTPGRYRVVVEGVGCSYPFEINADVWKKAFCVQMRGLFHNRSGVELGPPYTTFKKPRDFHPADGAVVTRTTYDPLTRGDDYFRGIVKGNTNEAAPDAWGGYHDAGDWNPRRASHMPVTMAQLELMELFPKYFSALKLNIPPMDGVPDLVTEALFEIDFFRRLQLPNGAVPYGIETDGDPEAGEVSWLSTMHAYVLAPNIRDTWHYAAAAARVSRILQPIKPELAKTYLESAKKAFAWAEADYADRKTKGTLKPYRKELWRAVDNRNLASLILYDITGEKNYHAIFLETTCLKNRYTGLYWYGKFIQSDAAFYYARLDDAKADPEIKKNAIAAILRGADASLKYGGKNAFNFTNGDMYRPLFGGFFSTSGGTELVHAHYLTGKTEYLEGAVRSCQFQLGCNPNNLVYTSGLGSNPVKNPLHLDSRFSGQPAPEGFTVFGNVDYWNNKGEFWTWPISFISKPDGCFPNPYDWPLTEAYFDIFMFVGINEFVIDTWAPNITVWGYLAARPAAPR